MDKVFLSLALIISGLTLGYVIQNLDRKEIIALPISIVNLRKTLQKMGLLFFMPISFLGAVWIVSFENVRVVLLPVVGLCSLLFGGVLALAFARMLKKENKDKAVLYCCGSFTNIGSVGSLVCFFFFGEAGFALAALYKMLEDISYYTIGFPLVRFLSGSSETVAWRDNRSLCSSRFHRFFPGLVPQSQRNSQTACLRDHYRDFCTSRYIHPARLHWFGYEILQCFPLCSRINSDKRHQIHRGPCIRLHPGLSFWFASAQ